MSIRGLRAEEKIMFGKKPILVAGAMSGTSLDGVDGAEIVTDGESIFEFGAAGYLPYSTQEQSVLHESLGKWPEDGGLERARDIVHAKHLEMFSTFGEAKLFGFHGQTLAHDPKGRGTHQLGDGARLAQRLARPVVWDFRSADVGRGGQGAPLAPFYHFACAKWIGAKAPLAVLNLGGVGNLTWIDPQKDAPEQEGALLAFDTGPANAPINDYMREYFGKDMDDEGQVARNGHVMESVLEQFLSDPYFRKLPPKSLDRDAFSKMAGLVAPAAAQDAIATLTAMSAASVINGLEFCPSPPEKILVTGGGRHNPTLMQMIADGSDCAVCKIEEVGLDGDMLEAQAFAFLAMRVVKGVATSAPSTTGVPHLTGGGILSLP
jgi:anhydro-N-acetylmuramic acid kinase